MTFGRLALLFVLIPVVELMLLIQLGRVVGLWPTVGLVLLTGFVGAGLARAEGVRVLAEFQAQLASGRLPGQALFDGISVLVGGALLLTPGVLTDLVGFALLFPPSRRWLQRRMRRRLERGIQQGTIRVVTLGGFPAGGFGRPGPGAPPGPRDGADLADRVEGRELDPRHGIEVPPDDR